MSDEQWFQEQEQQSQIKAIIVSKYFWVWAKVVIPTARKGAGKIAYIDLFAGPGRYEDGMKSTPLLILERAVADPDLRDMLVTMFNDKDEGHSRSLREAIAALSGIDTLRFPPEVFNQEVGTDISLRLSR